MSSCMHIGPSALARIATVCDIACYGLFGVVVRSLDGEPLYGEELSYICSFMVKEKIFYSRVVHK